MALHADQHGAADGDPVVLVHGFTQTGRSWGAVADALARDHTVVLVDAPGHGRTPPEHRRADLDRGGDLLVATAPRPATYVGYSMGGRLTLHAVVRHPDAVTAVVLVGATAGLDTDDDRAQRRQADEALAADLEARGLDPFLERWLANPLFAALTPAQQNVGDRRTNTVEGLAASLRRTGTGTQRPLWDDLAELTNIPALFVAGERDEKFTALAHRLDAAWGGPSAVALVEGAGHACHLEQPDAFLDVVLPFLDAHRATARPAASSTP